MQVLMAARSFVVAGVRAEAGAVNEKAAVARTARPATPIRVRIEVLASLLVLVFSVLVFRALLFSQVLPDGSHGTHCWASSSMERVFFAFRVLITTLRRH